MKLGRILVLTLLIPLVFQVKQCEEGDEKIGACEACEVEKICEETDTDNTDNIDETSADTDDTETKESCEDPVPCEDELSCEDGVCVGDNTFFDEDGVCKVREETDKETESSSTTDNEDNNNTKSFLSCTPSSSPDSSETEQTNEDSCISYVNIIKINIDSLSNYKLTGNLGFNLCNDYQVLFLKYQYKKNDTWLELAGNDILLAYINEYKKDKENITYFSSNNLTEMLWQSMASIEGERNVEIRLLIYQYEELIMKTKSKILSF